MDVLHYAGTVEVITREAQDLGIIYVVMPALERDSGDLCFFTPDGEGRIWFDSLAEAMLETGIDRVVEVETDPED